MGTWDELCILCGVAASGGCSVLGSKYGFDEDVKRIANDIAPGDEDIRQIVRDMLRATFSDDTHNVGHSYPWRPEGMGFQRYNEMLSVAIGHFDEKGECEKRGKLIRDGRGAEVRRVDGLNGGDFTEVVRVVNRREKLVPALSICSVFGNTPNVALCEPCYHYMDAWLARQDLPPRCCAFPSDPEPMSLGEELYEIVNSQQELRGAFCVGPYRCIWSEGHRKLKVQVPCRSYTTTASRILWVSGRTVSFQTVAAPGTSKELSQLVCAAQTSYLPCCKIAERICSCAPTCASFLILVYTLY